MHLSACQDVDFTIAHLFIEVLMIQVHWIEALERQKLLANGQLEGT